MCWEGGLGLGVFTLVTRCGDLSTRCGVFMIH